MLKHKHLIAGEWVDAPTTFQNEPVEGTPDTFALGSPELVDQAARAAEEAFWSFGYSSRSNRANFLRTIAREMEARGSEITAQGVKETGLPAARLENERARTTGQLNLFAEHIEKGDYLDRCHDEGNPQRAPLPKPDLKLVQRPVGPVGVFGASNFPLAFSTAGGDTAAALAAGCPVVVKGHSAHPGVCDLVAQAIDSAIKANGLHPGVFSQVQGSDRAIGQSLVQHPLIKAVGFTGSTGGGRALFDLCAARPEPIPFFGELGSVNPMFLLPHALLSDSVHIAKGWATSMTLGAGQFCTKPGVCVMLAGSDSDAFTNAMKEELANISEQAMLSGNISASYHQGRQKLSDNPAVEVTSWTHSGGRYGAPALFKTSVKNWLADPSLSEEVFGPAAIIVVADTMDEMHQFARTLEGQLTATIHHGFGDSETLRTLLPILERKAGRILFNGFPTGVEVSDAMVHGGPYPASTNFGATSVGTLSIRRFLRPVCYQNADWQMVGEV